MKISVIQAAAFLLFLSGSAVTATAGPTEENVIINEIMSSNIDLYISPSVNFDGWVELYNPTDQAVDLTGLYFSDDPTQLLKWKAPVGMGTLPAKGYATVWFDNNALKNTNVNFKLDIDGGSLYICDSQGNLITSQSYPEAVERTSYARTTDGGPEWGTTAEPTPGATNTSSSFASEVLEAPVVSHDDMLFTGRITIEVQIPEGYTLRYTTNGSLPTMENGFTSSTGKFNVYNNSCYRFRFFKEGAIPSSVVTRSYIRRDREYTGAILSVVSDSKFLYDNEIGVMVRGTNGKPGHGQDTKCNWNMDWERPVNFAYMPVDGHVSVNRNVYLEMCGGWSRAWEPHSFKLKGNKMFGTKNLNYPFFANKPYIRNRTLQIRNGGNDNYYRFLDPALQTILLTSGIDIDGQSYLPVHEFINGKYIGVLNMREPNNKHYVYANYGWDDDEIDQFEMDPDSAYLQKCGTPEAFNHLYELSKTASVSATYDEIRECLDIDEYINYMAMEMYLGSTDWPQNNVKGFAKRPDGRFRMVTFDLDFAFRTNSPFSTFANKQNYTFDYCYDTHSRISAEIKFVTIFLNLLCNEDFRRQFIDTFCLMGGSVFEASRCTTIIDSLINNVAPMMALENIYPENEANDLKSQLNGRMSTMTSAIRSYNAMHLTGVSPQSVTLSSNVPSANLYVNGIKVPTGYFKGRLFAPVQISAEAPAGYTFAGWVNQNSASNTLFFEGSTWAYYDRGSLDNVSWMSSTYNSSGWSQGNAPFGYGKSGVNTTLNYGNNSNNKRPTYYFRRAVTLNESPSESTTFKLPFTVDDGFIVYVNGTEAGRYNMPSGNVTYNTYATTYAPGNPDTGELTLPANLFHQGNNIIAVEVHNNSATSTDIYWDASLQTDMYEEDENYFSTESEIPLPEGNVSLVAHFEPMSATALELQGIHPVRINEVSADNSVFVNDFWKKNDWVELYNTTSHDIDVEGMYLSDNPEKPQKWQITKDNGIASTIIPAHGFLVIWCDKLSGGSELHASFKLDNDGGTVLLTSADESWTDELPYPAHDGNSTVGRYPDGSGRIFVMNVPTIRRPNQHSTYLTLYQDEADGISQPTLANYVSGMRMNYAAGHVILRGGQGNTARLTLYTLSGQQIETSGKALVNGTAQWSTASLPSGCYIGRATDDEGHTSSLKFVIN